MDKRLDLMTYLKNAVIAQIEYEIASREQGPDGYYGSASTEAENAEKAWQELEKYYMEDK